MSSRLFEYEIDGGQDVIALLPLIDMCNHKLPNKTDWKFNTKTNGFEIKATEKISEGEQIFIHYRKDIDASDFFINYGFHDKSVQSGIKVRIRLSPEEQHYQQKR